MTDETQTMEEVMEGVTQEDDTQAQTETETESKDAVDSSPQEQVDEVDETKPQDGVQRRINKLTAEKYGYKRELDELKQKLEAVENKQPPAKEPELEDFDFDEEKHNEALIQYQVQKQFEAQQLEMQRKQAEAAKAAKLSEFAAKEAEFALKHDDYMEVVQNMPHLPNETFEAITSLDNGAAVAYHLANNLDVAVELAALPPHLAALKLGQIALKVNASDKNIETSKAPAPVQTLKGSASVNKSIEDMSMDEIMKV